MAQNLSFAAQNFSAAVDLLEANRSRDALDSFRQAESFLDKVRLTFPYNSEARVLSLRISQVTDPEGFGARLRSLFNEAQDLEDRQEAYAQLRTIAELQPAYPGLAAAILELEYELQIKVRPPDPALVGQSNELLALAQRTVAGGDRTAFEGALAQLDEALRLNPANRVAVALKDQLQGVTGGGVQSVLSSASLELFREAERLFVDRNYIAAFRIVQGLVADERNSGYRPLFDLQERINRNL
jgi:tetratricopeptide (TPR) repeat protein